MHKRDLQKLIRPTWSSSVWLKWSIRRRFVKTPRYRITAAIKRVNLPSYTQRNISRFIRTQNRFLRALMRPPWTWWACACAIQRPLKPFSIIRVNETRSRESISSSYRRRSALDQLEHYRLFLLSGNQHWSCLDVLLVINSLFDWLWSVSTADLQKHGTCPKTCYKNYYGSTVLPWYIDIQ